MYRLFVLRLVLDKHRPEDVIETRTHYAVSCKLVHCRLADGFLCLCRPVFQCHRFRCVHRTTCTRTTTNKVFIFSLGSASADYFRVQRYEISFTCSNFLFYSQPNDLRNQ